jgi:hypothetical protein
LAIVPDGSHSDASLPSKIRNTRFERIEARVIAILHVAHRGLGHHGAHRIGGTGDGIGTQVDHSDFLLQAGRKTPCTNELRN